MRHYEIMFSPDVACGLSRKDNRGTMEVSLVECRDCQLAALRMTERHIGTLQVQISSLQNQKEGALKDLELLQEKLK